MKKFLLTPGITLLLFLSVHGTNAQQVQVFPTAPSLMFFPIGDESTVKQGFPTPQSPEKNLIGAYVQNNNPQNLFTVASLVVPFRAKVVKTLSPFNGIVAVALPYGQTRSIIYMLSMNWGSAQIPATLVAGTMSNILIILETTVKEWQVLQSAETAATAPFRFLNPVGQYQNLPLPLRYASVQDGIKQFLSPLYSVEDALRLSGLCYQKQNCLENVENYMKTRGP